MESCRVSSVGDGEMEICHMSRVGDRRRFVTCLRWATDGVLLHVRGG